MPAVWWWWCGGGGGGRRLRWWRVADGGCGGGAASNQPATPGYGLGITGLFGSGTPGTNFYGGNGGENGGTYSGARA